MKRLIFIILILTVACEERVEFSPDLSDNEVIVVDALITNEIKYHKIKLSGLSESPSVNKPIITDASVIVRYNDKNIHFVEGAEKGTYISDQQFGAVTNLFYNFYVNYNGKEYYARDHATPLFSLDTLSVLPFDTLGNYYIEPPDEFNPTESSMYEIIIKNPVTSDSVAARFYYYSLNTVDISQVFTGSKERVLFNKGVTIIQRKYSLSPKHEEFVRTMLLETTWNGNAFDIENENVYTNISPGGLGFFGVCMVNEIKYIFF